ncbi:MAG: VOC family protein [Pseudonocardiaceae bacterium]|nr:VOC family protein [Pseudonocardiaceae bacterium]
MTTGNVLPRFDLVAIDCPDPLALSNFYAELLGWPPDPEPDPENQWIQLSNPNGGVDIAFQRSPDYQPPTWPEGPRPQMLHLDFDVSDAESAQQHAVAVGARLIEGPEKHPKFRVFLDPVGHPFCLCG